MQKQVANGEGDKHGAGDSGELSPVSSNSAESLESGPSLDSSPSQLLTVDAAVLAATSPLPAPEIVNDKLAADKAAADQAAADAAAAAAAAVSSSTLLDPASSSAGFNPGPRPGVGLVNNTFGRYDDDVSFYNSTASTWTLATPRTTCESVLSIPLPEDMSASIHLDNHVCVLRVGRQCS